MDKENKEREKSDLANKSMILSILKDNRPVDSVTLSPEIKSVFLLGSSHSCDVVLHDLAVPAEHAELVFDNAGWRIRQISAQGELIVNNAIVSESNLKSGDVICTEFYVLLCVSEK